MIVTSLGKIHRQCYDSYMIKLLLDYLVRKEDFVCDLVNYTGETVAVLSASHITSSKLHLITLKIKLASPIIQNTSLNYSVQYIKLHRSAPHHILKIVHSRVEVQQKGAPPPLTTQVASRRFADKRPIVVTIVRSDGIPRVVETAVGMPADVRRIGLR